MKTLILRENDFEEREWHKKEWILPVIYRATFMVNW
jgi:hypothetical protein